MLYDPKWDKPSLEGFIGWLEVQPSNGKYDFQCIRGNCLIGQYMTAVGREWNWSDYNQTCRDIGDCAIPIAASHPMTFGAALKRAKEFSKNDVSAGR